MAGEHFSVTKRVFEKQAIVAFIDLLGTREFYHTGLTEQQARRTASVLLSRFSICFSRYFRPAEIKQNFDVNIFSDSAVISERRKTSRIVERLVDFTLGYQAELLLMGIPSRTSIVKDSFFSLKVMDADPSTILGSPYTTISLCGGGAVGLAHDCQEGLPIGVYLQARAMEGLNTGQRARVLPVRGNPDLFFIKQKYDVLNFLADLAPKTHRLLVNNPDASRVAIRRSLLSSNPYELALGKFLPWLMVHFGRENEIVRSIKAPVADSGHR